MESFFVPEWPAPPHVRALSTTRLGGFGSGCFASLNLADHVGDDPGIVARNRHGLRALAGLPAEPVWLKQVHGRHCVDLADETASLTADASLSRLPARVCAVLTADCLPLLVCDTAGSVVAAIHAGWRGLAAGVIEATIGAIGLESSKLLVWLGPAIGPRMFEVGNDVRTAFVERDEGCCTAFAPLRDGKWLCDIYALATRRLAGLGVSAIYGGGACTVEDSTRYFSYRRDGVTGRMASLIWLDGHV